MTQIKYEKKNKVKGKDIIAVFFFASSVLIGIALWLPQVKTGFFGQWFQKLSYGLLGNSVNILPFFLFFIAIDSLLTKTRKVSKTRKNCAIFLFLTAVILVAVLNLDLDKVYAASRVKGQATAFKAISVFWQSGLKPNLVAADTAWTGGLLGGLLGFSLMVVAGRVGAIIILLAVALALVVVVFDISYSQYLKKSAEVLQQTRQKLEEKRRERLEQKQANLEQDQGTESDAPDELKADQDQLDVEKLTPRDGYDYDLSKNLNAEEGCQINDEWPEQELAKDLEEDYGEPFKVQYDLPAGSWRTAKGDFVGQSGLSFPGLTGEEHAGSEKTPGLRDSGVESLQRPETKVGRSVEVPPIEASETRPIELAEGNEGFEPKSQTSIRKLGLKDTAEQERPDQLSADIPEADLEIIEDQGRAHWEDRSDVPATSTKTDYRKKGKQLSLTDSYIPPDPNLLADQPSLKQDEESIQEIKQLGARLEQTLKEFGVDAQVINYTTGPTITRFELSPGPGVKVSRITNLADDIALALAAIGVRIEAPIPGKSAIGIEIPNKETSPVFLGGIIRSKAFKDNKSVLTAGIGRDIQGNEILCDLAKMPHLLIAGATGSGKSVCINAIIISLLYRSGPQDLRLIMIDPKVVELNIYNGIPHLLQPVVTNPKKAYGALNWAISEMEDRYQKFADNSVRDFTAYNSLVESGQVEGEKLPAIVIIIDELSDLMATTPTEVEDAIARLTAMARAAGIHLIIATQRPSVDVITGVIKANIPSRIAFTVASQVDSRTILDMGGAEKLLGKGDMLYYPQSAAKPLRGQGAFITDAEVDRVTKFLKDYYETDYDETVAQAMENVASASGGISPGVNQEEEEDELLDDALRLVIESEYASISLLQRRLSIGYPRAARLIDRLHELGFVGPPEGSKPRKVLITMAEYLNAENEPDGEDLE